MFFFPSYNEVKITAKCFMAHIQKINPNPPLSVFFYSKVKLKTVVKKASPYLCVIEMVEIISVRTLVYIEMSCIFARILRFICLIKYHTSHIMLYCLLLLKRTHGILFSISHGSGGETNQKYSNLQLSYKTN